MSLSRSFSAPTMNVTNSERVLKNYCKAKGYEKPIYRITSRNSTWIDGRVYRFKHYVSVVSVNGFSLSEGDGFSKRLARKKAAMLGLQQLRVYELQNFWQVFHTIVPQGLLKDSGRDDRMDITSTLTIDKTLMITTSAVQIEELVPTEGIMTPQSVLQFSLQHNLRRSEKPQQQRERSPSSDSSSSLINAAIEKLRRYTDDEDDDAGWERKENEEKQSEIKQQEKLKVPGESHKEDKERKEKPAFSDEEMLMFNEKKSHHKKGNDIKAIIEGVAKEIETIEENGYDDLGL